MIGGSLASIVARPPATSTDVMRTDSGSSQGALDFWSMLLAALAPSPTSGLESEVSDAHVAGPEAEESPVTIREESDAPNDLVETDVERTSSGGVFGVRARKDLREDESYGGSDRSAHEGELGGIAWAGAERLDMAPDLGVGEPRETEFLTGAQGVGALKDRLSEDRVHSRAGGTGDVEDTSAKLHAIEVATVRSADSVPGDTTPVTDVPVSVMGVSERNDSLDLVTPELRSKVDRVIRRMREEFGHDVSVIEGYRSPERQAYLYTQGRTRPGPTVTWTLDSRHTDGEAVDVLVDGGYENDVAYRRLQFVAVSEGLDTLGQQDRGHLELPTDQETSSGRLTVLAPARERVMETPAVVARAAVVARTARVASPARPGRAPSRSSIAEPPSGPALARGERGRTDADAPEPPSGPALVRGERGRTDAHASEPPSGPALARGERGRTDADASEPSVRPVSAAVAQRISALGIDDDAGEGGAPVGSALSSGGAQVWHPTPPSGDVLGVSLTNEFSTLDRVEKILDARELTEGAPRSVVSLNLGTEGPISRLRVGLLRGTIEAQVELADAADARFVRARVTELYDALRTQGLELGTLDLASTSRSVRDGTSWLSGGIESANDIVRSLLAGRSDSGRSGDGRDRTHQEHGTNQNGGGSGNRRQRQKEAD